MQPVRRYGVDAAVLYSDIVAACARRRLRHRRRAGTGPVAAAPFRAGSDLRRLRPLQPGDIAYVADTVTRVAAEPGRLDAGAGVRGRSLSLGRYLVEGRPSRTYEHTKALLHTDLRVARADGRPGGDGRGVRRRPARRRGSGVPTVRLWAGTLSVADYDRFVLPTHGACSPSWPSGTRTHRDPFRHRVRPPARVDGRRGAQVIGLDWRTSIAAARKRLGDYARIQGNLDPALVLAGGTSPSPVPPAVLADNGGWPGHIFNLGHGVHPSSDPGVLAAVVDYVHEATRS